MNQQPDKLFRDKLENLSRPVSANAWSRVEARLDKKKGSGLWLKIAASLLIIALVGTAVWKNNQRADTTIAESKPKETTAPTLPDKTTVKKETPPAIATDKTEERKMTSTKPVKRDRSQKEKPSDTTPHHEHSAEKMLAVSETQSEVPGSVEEKAETITTPVNRVEKSETRVASNQPSSTGGVTIIFTASEIDDKYLDKKSLAEATSGDKKPSTLRKLIDKAYDLTNNEDPLGDLRQKKNEILALNFRNDKQRSENK